MYRAENEKYILRVEPDMNPLNPRKDFSNFGTMVCWHSRYNLGDEHDYSEPRYFLSEMVREVAGDALREKIREVLHVEEDEIDGEFCVMAGGYFVEAGYKSVEDAEDAIENEWIDYIFDEAEDYLPREYFFELIEENAFILPLRLYDHSGVSMSTSRSYPYNDPWDAGRVGWIYATHEKARKEFGELTHEVIERVYKTLEAEVETYSQYLEGDVWGFSLVEKKPCGSCGHIEEELIDSCCGFFGRDWENNGIKDCLPEDAHSLVDEMEYVEPRYTYV